MASFDYDVVASRPEMRKRTWLACWAPWLMSDRWRRHISCHLPVVPGGSGLYDALLERGGIASVVVAHHAATVARHHLGLAPHARRRVTERIAKWTEREAQPWQ